MNATALQNNNNASTPADRWPDHFSPQDIEIAQSIGPWLKQREYSQSALARLARCSASSVSQILNGTYPTSPTKMLASIASAMRRVDDADDAVPPVETSTLRLAEAACRMARRHRNFSVFTGFPGTGKTYAMRHYAATHPNTFLVECTPSMTELVLFKRLARMALGCDVRGTFSDKFEAVVDTLRNTDTLVIIDEAETLSPTPLEAVRRLRDLAGIGIVLSGTEKLTGIIKPKYGQFDQIRSRTGFWPETIPRISREDAAALVQAAFGQEEVSDAVIERLYAFCRGSARVLMEGFVPAIREFRKDLALDVKLVDAVAKQALCLQAVAE